MHSRGAGKWISYRAKIANGLWVGAIGEIGGGKWEKPYREMLSDERWVRLRPRGIGSVDLTNANYRDRMDWRAIAMCWYILGPHSPGATGNLNFSHPWGPIISRWVRELLRVTPPANALASVVTPAEEKCEVSFKDAPSWNWEKGRWFNQFNCAGLFVA